MINKEPKKHFLPNNKAPKNSNISLLEKCSLWLAIFGLIVLLADKNPLYKIGGLLVALIFFFLSRNYLKFLFKRENLKSLFTASSTPLLNEKQKADQEFKKQKIIDELAKYEIIISDPDSINPDYGFDLPDEVIKSLEASENPFSYVEPILRLMENNPSADFGSPGSLTHFIEKYYGKGYEKLLLESLNRKPTMFTIWLAQRLLNSPTTDAEVKEVYITDLKRISNSGSLDDALKYEITDNLLGIETISSKVILPDNNIVDAIFELYFSAKGDEVSVKLFFNNREITENAYTFWDALIKLRLQLEKENILIKCFGSCENVYPSAMALDMGNGQLAYKMKLKEPIKSKNALVDIFAYDDSIIPVTVAVQEAFYNDWIKSLGYCFK